MLGDDDDTEEPQEDTPEPMFGTIVPPDKRWNTADNIFASIDSILSSPSQEDPASYKPVIEAEEAPEKEDLLDDIPLVPEHPIQNEITHPIHSGPTPETTLTTTEPQTTSQAPAARENKQVVASKDMEISVESLSLNFTEEDWRALSLTPQQTKLVAFVLQSNILALNNTVQTYKSAESGSDIRATSKQVQEMTLTLANVIARLTFPNVIEGPQKSRGVVYPIS